MSLSNFVKRVRNIMRNDAGINGDAQRIEQMARKRMIGSWTMMITSLLFQKNAVGATGRMTMEAVMP